MEPHAFVVLLVVELCVLASVSTQRNIHGRVNDDAGIFTRDTTEASTTPRAHNLSSISPVPDTDGTRSLGRAAPLLPWSLFTEGPKKKTKKKSSEISCSLRNKCSVGHNKAALDFVARNCFCDVLCHTYGDCCMDATKPARRQVGRCLTGVHHVTCNFTLKAELLKCNIFWVLLSI